MRIHVLLADSAQMDPSGKVHALGLGWTVTGTPTPPCALIALIWVEWNEANRKFHLTGSLVDGDGVLIEVDGPDGRGPITFGGEIEAGRPPGLPAGTPQLFPLVLNLSPGLVLAPGNRYEWRLEADTQPPTIGLAGFLVRT
jgi:hypothetical protein